MTTTQASLVNSGYVASEQTAKKILLPTIRLLLSTYLLPGNAFSEPFLSNLGGTTLSMRLTPVCQHTEGINATLHHWRLITFPRLHFLSVSRFITIRIMAQSYYRPIKIEGQREGGNTTRRAGRAKQY
jgi:hypothetical protein